MPKREIQILVGLVILAWSIELVNAILFRGRMHAWGIQPREIAGLKGILLAPLLHAGVKHLAANTVPFLVLGWLVMMRGKRVFFAVTVDVMIIAGLAVWILGARNSVHIGASGIIFGYLGYLLGAAFFERNVLSLFLAVVAAGLYGSILWGVLPGQPGISWMGHLFGFIAGAISARFLGRRPPEPGVKHAI